MTCYWTESMSEILSDAGVTVTREQLAAIAEGARWAARMESEAMGTQYIPNPMKAEVDELKRHLAKSREETDQQRREFIANVCMSHGCEPHQVHLDGKYVTIYK